MNKKKTEECTFCGEPVISPEERDCHLTCLALDATTERLEFDLNDTRFIP